MCGFGTRFQIVSKQSFFFFFFIKGVMALEFMALMVCVNDITIFDNNSSTMHALKDSLSQSFKLCDLRTPNFFLGIHITTSKLGIFILVDARQLSCKLVYIPAEPNAKLSHINGELCSDPTTYRRLMDKLLYLTITRLDLSFIINWLSQYVSSLQVTHMKAAIRIL